MTNWRGNGGGWGGDAPVFSSNYEYRWGGKKWPYPDVWITEQRWEPTSTSTGRDCVWHYTPEDDPELILSSDNPRYAPFRRLKEDILKVFKVVYIGKNL